MRYCAIIPWLEARERHHYTYKDYGVNRYANTISVSKFGHWMIHCAGLSPIPGRGAVRRQNTLAKKLGLKLILGYPNPLQRALHLWGRSPRWLKIFALKFAGYVGAIVAIVFWVLSNTQLEAVG